MRKGTQNFPDTPGSPEGNTEGPGTASSAEKALIKRLAALFKLLRMVVVARRNFMQTGSFPGPLAGIPVLVFYLPSISQVPF